MPFADREQQLAYWRAYAAKNKEKKAAYDRDYGDVNRERRRVQAVERRRLNARGERERARVYSAFRYSKDRNAIIDAYGAKCACCGTTYRNHLSIDHVDGGGRQDRAQNGGQRNVLSRIIRDGFPPDYQVLCHNCNHAKHVLGRCTCSDTEHVPLAD